MKRPIFKRQIDVHRYALIIEKIEPGAAVRGDDEYAVCVGAMEQVQMNVVSYQDVGVLALYVDLRSWCFIAKRRDENN
jgi:hypothetical protein